MQRKISGFHQDSQEDWVAELTCGHQQHMRHDPPFLERAWVTTEKGRNSRCGERIDCAACARSQIPSHFEPYQRTEVFDEVTVPAGLLANHTTKAGVWGQIHVQSGCLE